MGEPDFADLFRRAAKVKSSAQFLLVTVGASTLFSLVGLNLLLFALFAARHETSV